MWDVGIEEVVPGTSHVEIRGPGGTLGFGEVLRLWSEDGAFRSRFLQLWAEAPYAAYQWETPPVTEATVGRPFECVFVSAPELAGRAADPSDFRAHFNAAGTATVVAFPNLGGDAQLIVPCPVGPLDAYNHLAAFARGAPESRGHLLLSEISRAVMLGMGRAPLWLNTAGQGVPWVHVRLDSRPKYYRYGPYRTA